MNFEFYVPNYNHNQHRVEMFNIFRNCNVQEWTEKAVKKYLRFPSKYKYVRSHTDNEDIYYGFKGFVKELDSIIRWQELFRREYETSISDAFVYEIDDLIKDFDKYESLEDLKTDLERINSRNPKLEKWDCYQYCKPNMEIIAHEVIRQYKEQRLKNERR